MNLTVTGKQLDIGDAFRAHMAEKLEKMLAKYFGKALDVTVTISRDAHRYRAVIDAHISRSVEMNAEGLGKEPYPAFDDAAEHLAKRLRRHKRRLRDHNAPGGKEAPEESAAAYVLRHDEEVEEKHDGSDHAVVAELDVVIPTLTVGEAAMRLDLSNRPFLLFRNAAHGEINLLHRREDGHLGWIDPKGARSPKRA